MNKVFLILPCITGYSFLCATEQPPKPSPRQSSPRAITIAFDNDIRPTRSRLPSDPILRVKKQSQPSDMFSKEENISSGTLHRTNSAEKK